MLQVMENRIEKTVAHPALTTPVAAAGSPPVLQSKTAVRDRNAPKRAGGGSTPRPAAVIADDLIRERNQYARRVMGDVRAGRKELEGAQ